MANVDGFPRVIDPRKVGTYPARAGAGGGYVWDDVLEYRVWCHPERGAKDLCEGNDYYYAFESYAGARDFSQKTEGAEEPLALIVQREYIDEPEPHQFTHVKQERVTEWPVDFLTRPRRTDTTILEFLAEVNLDRALAKLRGDTVDGS
ncbi:MAG: GCN5 family acetyltransferase [Pseudomonadota bacterium]